MKPRLLTAVCTLFLTLCAVSTPAAAQYTTNVILEGPWILYVDKTLINSSHPVLVAVSPGGVYNEGNTNMFHTPWVSAGDGYPVGTPNIYCLHWGDEKCAPTVSAATALVPLTTPEKAPLLPMNAAQPGKTWPWASKAGITAFILPMPDSYSAVAGWYMRFAPQWDESGNSYNPYPDKVEKHSIGIELHYQNGPSYSTKGASYFSLDKCAVTGGKLGTCSDAGGDLDHATKLDNVGTLSITMKSPTADPCDPHVRMAYPIVLALLDGDNHLYRAIDTAKSTYKSGAPEYDEPNDNPRCLTEYPINFVAEAKGTDVAADAARSSEKLDAVALWTNQLSQFSSRIGEYLQQTHDRDDENRKLLLSQIQKAIKNMNMDFPKFSQMRLLVMLLKRSEAQADSMLGVHEESQTSLMRETDTKPANRMSEAQAKSPAEQTGTYWSSLLKIPLTVPSLALLDEYFQDTAPLTKSGNDCNAPLILAATP